MFFLIILLLQVLVLHHFTLIFLETIKCIYKYNINLKTYLQKFISPKQKLKKIDILLHAVSCGEVLSLQPIINYLENNNIKYLISVHTPTGLELIKKKNKNAILKPFDTFPTMLYLLLKTRPKIICISESDAWPFFILISKCMGIKIFFINYTIKKEKPIRNWLHKKIATKIFLKKDVGNLKILSTNIKIKMNKINNYKTIIIASANKNEFDLHNKYMKEMLELDKNIRFIYVPRHLNWLKEFQEKMSSDYYLLYDCREFDIDILFKKYNIITVWSFGLLEQLYSYSNICLMGDTFNEVGGHNIIEPAVCNNIIILGPNYHTCIDLVPLINDIYFVKTLTELTELTYKLISNQLISDPLVCNKDGIIKEQKKIKRKFNIMMKKITNSL